MLPFHIIAKGNFHDHDDHGHEHPPRSLDFIQNNNQFHEAVRFQAGLGGLNRVFLEEQGFTYLFHGEKEMGELHDLRQKSKAEQERHVVPAHAYKVHFEGALKPDIAGAGKRPFHHNYFLGNDPEKWAAKVPLYEKVIYQNLYDGIDLEAYSQEGNFKYDFIIAPGHNPDQIKIHYDGMDKLLLKDEHLYIYTSVGMINEFKPYAYQIIDGETVELPCQYQLHNNTISYFFPDDFHPEYPLVIDPTVVAATLTGTVNNQNYGHTATFDNEGNMYGGGISFGPGFPTDVGSFQTNYGGGNTDVAIIKFNEDGSEVIYATYIGGSDGDFPHSMIVDYNNQLCVFGSTTSANFPTTENAFQQDYAGDRDVFVTKLNADGSALVGSTYLGGSDSDGFNQANNNTNYGEEFRGEIVLDQQGNILVGSVSSSSDFPTTTNAFQPIYNNNTTTGTAQDGVVFKLNSDLSILFWSTYLGGDNPDTATGLRVNDEGQVYVTGTAGHDNFPVTAGTIQDTWPGGIENAYVAILSSDGQELLKATFWGTTGDDHAYFTDFDEDGNIHIFGQTDGEMPITPDTYFFNEGSRQFFAAFDSELETLVYSTVIGTGSVASDFVPVAFMVDKCNGIYFSGYQSRSGLPLTDDAIYTQSSSFYLGKLEPNAVGLSFGTYYGDADHVDGGTSRFDKSGIVYQGVCSCSGSVLNTLPNAWATGQELFCDLGVFKIDFEIATVTAAAVAAPSASGCAPFTVNFEYTGQDATEFFWDFGSDETSVLENPTHTFNEPGTYTVMQIANAPNTCNAADTFFLQIDVLDGSSTRVDTTICTNGNSYFLDASTINATYNWQDGYTGATYEVMSGGTYWVDITLGGSGAGCSRRDSFVVQPTTAIEADLGEDLFYCDIADHIIDATSPFAIAYEWSTGDTASEITVDVSGEYWVAITDVNNCTIKDTIAVTFTEPPTIDLGPDTALCTGESFFMDATIPGATYIWQDSSTSAVYNSNITGTYWVEVNLNQCLAWDTVVVKPPTPLAVNLGPDTSVCDVASLMINATDPWAEEYTWSTGSNMAEIEVTQSGEYWVSLRDSVGCEIRDTVDFIFSTTPEIVFHDTTVCEGESITLNATTPDATYLWQDSSVQTTFTTGIEGTYWVEVDHYGCIGAAEMNLAISYPPGIAFMTTDANCYESCDGTISALIPAGDNFNFAWNNDNFDANQSGLCAGTYEVVMSNEFDCTYYDTVAIAQPTPLDFEVIHEDVNCYGDGDGIIEILNTTGGVLPYAYHLNEDSLQTSTYFSGLDGGAYRVFLTDGNDCQDSLNVFVYEPPNVQLSAGDDITVSLGDDTKIEGLVWPIENQVIEWTPPIYLDCDTCITPVALPHHTTVYTISAVDSITGCSYSDNMELQVIKPRPIYIPNVFSPNEDGRNDWFSVFADESVEEILSFKVFDRWGELLFERHNFQPNQESLGWDGMFNGSPMNPAVFVYLVEIAFIDGVEEMYTGDVMLLR